MKSDLSKVKVGDKIWTIQEGWTEVIDVIKDDCCYPIDTKENSYTLDGRYDYEDKHPSAFLTNPFESQEPKEWLVRDSIGSIISWVKRKGIPINGKFYIESDWEEWKEIEPISELTIEERIKRIEQQLKIK